MSARELTSLIVDEERLRAERSDRKSWKSRVSGIEEFSSSSHDGPSRRPRERTHRPQRADEEDAEYKLAIEASKYQEEEDRKKRQSRGGEPDDEDLAKAIKLSKEEEELRLRELEESNAASLFDDNPIQTAQPQYTGFNQGYQQQGAVDWSGNPIDQSMQAQPTGYINNGYTGFQSQPTGYPNGFQNGFQNGFAPQPTGYDVFGAQQQQQQQQQLQPGSSPFGVQQTGYNPYAQQQTGFEQQQQQQPEPLIPANTNNPWATTSQQQQPLQPTKTGSNNPFAASTHSNPPPMPSQPTLSTLQEQKTLSQFNNSSFNPPTSFSSPPPQQFQAPPKSQNPYEAKLNALLENGEGMDTFGNTGNLRIPAQHTAPGTFVNSAGSGISRLHDQQTGSNPFMQNTFTGLPQTTYGGQPGGFSGQQIPAATGPANMGYSGAYNAQGNSNPFGQRQGQQQGQGQGGDLIQF